MGKEYLDWNSAPSYVGIQKVLYKGKIHIVHGSNNIPTKAINDKKRL